jgi:hypothetical protein
MNSLSLEQLAFDNLLTAASNHYTVNEELALLELRAEILVDVHNQAAPTLKPFQLALHKLQFVCSLAILLSEKDIILKHPKQFVLKKWNSDLIDAELNLIESRIEELQELKEKLANDWPRSNVSAINTEGKSSLYRLVNDYLSKF